MYANALPALINPVYGLPGRAYDFVGGNTVFDSRLTVTRSTTDPYFDANSVQQAASPDTGRLDHDPLTGAALGGLVERGATNSILRSREFENAVWHNFQTDISENTATAPDGTATGDRLIALVSDSNHTIRPAANLTYVQGNTYTLAVDAKYSDYSYISVRPGSSNMSSTGVWFNIQAGTVGTIEANVDSASIRPRGNGWYRCSVTITYTPATGTDGTAIMLVPSDGVQLFAGDGVSGNFLWEAQREDGPAATSPVTTEATAASRGREAIADSYDFPAAAGSVILTGRVRDILGVDTRRAFTMRAGAGTEEIYVEFSTAGGVAARVRGASTNHIGASFSSGVDIDAADTRFALAIAWADNDQYAYFNNITRGATDALTATAATAPDFSGVDGQWFGNHESSDFGLNGWIERALFYPARLPNATLQKLAA